MSRTYFITGASSGFGAALATAVLERGDRAVLAARRLDALQEIAAAYPQTAHAVRLDVTIARDCERVVTQARELFGRIDVLANIAGRGSLGAAEEFSATQLREQMELNFFAAAELTRLVLPAMRARQSGHILNLSGIAGLVSFGGFAAYCASKFALEGWSEALREDIKPFGIRVTLVEAGSFRTDFAGDNHMRADGPIDAYRPTLAPIEKFVYGTHGRQTGDPRKAALAMIAAVESAEPPLRLMLGADAQSLWEKKLTAMQGEIAQWRESGSNMRFDRAALKSV